MNSQLEIMYDIELNKEKLLNIFSTEELNKISAPHLLSIDKNYINSDIKILYVGKETNRWWGKLKHFIETTDSISILQQRYRAKFFGGNVPKSNNLKELKHYKAESYSTPFFTEYKKISHSLLNAQKGALVWTNLLKMDLDRNKGYSRNSKGNKDIVLLSKTIFLKEIEILKPDYIVFATSYTYDKVIKSFFGENIYNSQVIEPKSLWRFQVDNITCFRTWHPSTIKYKALKNKLAYYKDIINYIKEDIKQKYKK